MKNFLIIIGLILSGMGIHLLLDGRVSNFLSYMIILTFGFIIAFFLKKNNIKQKSE